MTISTAEAQYRLAHLLVTIGLNIQKGQPVVLWKAPVESLQFIRKIVEECYKAGSSSVDIFWADPFIDMLRLSSSPDGCCAPQIERSIAGLEKALGEKAAILLFDCTCAGMFDNIGIGILSRDSSCETKLLGPMWEELSKSHTNWTMTAAPNISWANKIYPTTPPHFAFQNLWQDFSAACRITEPTYISDWKEHIGILSRKTEKLNNQSYTSLHYKGPNADLHVKLPEFHLWRGPDFVSESGVHFVPNIPMEEIFTLPHRTGVDGWINTDVPFIVNGEIVEGLSVSFEEGIAVKVSAKRGEHLLNSVLDTDEGARRLGEVALVPSSSPVGLTERLFYNTIIDENAACHIAFGRAYRFSARNGTLMTDREFIDAGGNLSDIHIDFMVDMKTTEIRGISKNGEEDILFPENN